MRVNIVSLKIFRVDGCLWFVEVRERANRDNLGWGSGTTFHCTFHSLHISDIVQTAADVTSRGTAAAELAAVPCFKLVFTTFVGCCGPFAAAQAEEKGAILGLRGYGHGRGEGGGGEGRHRGGGEVELSRS